MYNLFLTSITKNLVVKMNREHQEQKLEQMLFNFRGCLPSFDHNLTPQQQLNFVRLHSKIMCFSGRFCFNELAALELELLLELMYIIHKEPIL